MWVWIKDKVLLLYAIGLELLKHRFKESPDDGKPLSPIVKAEAHEMIWRPEHPTRPDVPDARKPLRGSLADRVEKARK
jgi:hypothetical protein